VFVAGGIGITPFRSILEDREGGKAPGSILLLYSNRRPQDAAFLQELRQLSEGRGRFRMIATITEPDFAESSWDGETGRIDAELIEKAVRQPAGADFYIAGPPGMVEAMQNLVQGAGVPAKQIHAEQFAGYEERSVGG
jgi:ferredoxin-NADP reductase